MGIDVSGLGNLPDLSLDEQQLASVRAKLGTVTQEEVDVVRQRLRELADAQDFAKALVTNGVTVLKIAAMLAV